MNKKELEAFGQSSAIQELYEENNGLTYQIQVNTGNLNTFLEMFRSMSVTPLNTTVSQMRFYMDGSQYQPVQSLEAVRKILRQQGFITQQTEKAKPSAALAILS